MAHKNPLVARMPASAQATFARLLEAGDDRDAEVLRMALDRYVEVIEDAAKTKTHIDLPLARKIGASCRALLDMLGESDEEQHARIFAAVEYFLLPADGEDDLAVPDGLDDDAAVVSQVAYSVGREELMITIPERG
ncbi:MAG: hypothetical protein AAF721_00515 [Myxococcota bacterium]